MVKLHPSRIEARRARNRAADAVRRFEKGWRAWYSSRRWHGLRRMQLAKQPCCERCDERGITTAATVVHHKQRHEGNRELFFDPNNLASSCAECHDVDEQRIERGGKARTTVGVDGWPT